MTRMFKIAVLITALCVVALIFVSCDKGEGDTSGNASDGIISQDGSQGGVVSEVVSDIVSEGEELVSDIFDMTSDDGHESFVSEGAAGEL